MACIIKRILTIQVPIQFHELRVMSDAQVVTESCLYSWSTDTVCWTNWVDYNTYLKTAYTIESDFYLRILLMTGFTELYIDNTLTDCYSICLYNENPYLQDLCSVSNIDFYAGLDCALLLQQQLSDLICCLIGIPCYYFRVTPQRDSADYTFKEYILHNVTDVKYIKLVCEEGQLPSSRPQMTEFDFDWDNDWEVELGKTMFANAFGDTAFPKQRDMIYIPMMKRMYEVNAAYDEKQEMLMWRATTWKLGLVKWTEKTNVNQGDFEEVIDNWVETKFVDDWLPRELTEQERQTGTNQTVTPTHAATNLTNIFMEDAIRKQITDFERPNIIAQQVNHGSIITARNFYRFTSESSIITYQKQWCSDTGTVMFLCSASAAPNQRKNIIKVSNLEISIDQSDIGFKIIFGDIEADLKFNTLYSIVCTWNRQKVQTGMIIYEHTYDTRIPLYRMKAEAYQFTEVAEYIGSYNEDYSIEQPVEIICSPAPLLFTNFKIYNTVFSKEDETREMIKYATTSEYCILNDTARPIEAPHGYSPK